MRIIKIVGLLFLGVFALRGISTLWETKRPDPPKAKITPPVVRIVTLQSESFARRVERHARLQPRRKWQIALEVSGRLAQRPVENGDLLERGALVLALDPEPFVANLEHGEAMLRQAQARTTLAGEILERIKRLYKTKSASREELDQEQADLDASLAVVAAAQADVRKDRYDLEHCRWAAPAPGIVSALSTEVGEFVREGDVLGEFSQVDSLLVKVLVPWDIRRGVEPGTKGVVVDGWQREHSATLLYAAAVQSGQTGQFELEFEVPNPTGELLSGEPVVVRFESGAPIERLRVPRNSIFEEYGQWRALVPGERPDDSTEPFLARSVPITQGGGDPGEGWVEVYTGLRPGQEILVPSRVAALRDGTRIVEGRVTDVWLPPYATPTKRSSSLADLDAPAESVLDDSQVSTPIQEDSP
ncbi:Multidrug resistance protein MdtE precursor [Planctomycetes bacterium Pan216]|uniref:Multidrug resistance protein MdtE n=1 Tax=Kolteria novifilia TaxID=2527975 RepID=A0A518AWS4_9BACT|nr:Multidrug resistance protein MdtE precursor [Planctomycetes bacterium Pan216]